MWALVLKYAPVVLGLVSKLWGGGASAATAGDQKAVDEQAAVKGAAIVLQGDAQPNTPDLTKKALDDGTF